MVAVARSDRSRRLWIDPATITISVVGVAGVGRTVWRVGGAEVGEADSLQHEHRLPAGGAE
jgi:hypothetical protein